MTGTSIGQKRKRGGDEPKDCPATFKNLLPPMRDTRSEEPEPDDQYTLRSRKVPLIQMTTGRRLSPDAVPDASGKRIVQAMKNANDRAYSSGKNPLRAQTKRQRHTALEKIQAVGRPQSKPPAVQKSSTELQHGKCQPIKRMQLSSSKNQGGRPATSCEIFKSKVEAKTAARQCPSEQPLTPNEWRAMLAENGKFENLVHSVLHGNLDQCEGISENLAKDI